MSIEPDLGCNIMLVSIRVCFNFEHSRLSARDLDPLRKLETLVTNFFWIHIWLTNIFCFRFTFYFSRRTSFGPAKCLILIIHLTLSTFVGLFDRFDHFDQFDHFFDHLYDPIVDLVKCAVVHEGRSGHQLVVSVNTDLRDICKTNATFFILLLHFCHAKVANLMFFLLLCSPVVLA